MRFKALNSTFVFCLWNWRRRRTPKRFPKSITNNTSARCVFKNNLRCVIMRVEPKKSMSSLIVHLARTKLQFLNLRKGERLNLKRKGSEAFAKGEKKAPSSQPGLEPVSSAYAADALPLERLGPAHVQISSVTASHRFASASQHKPHPRPTWLYPLPWDCHVSIVHLAMKIVLKDTPSGSIVSNWFWKMFRRSTPSSVPQTENKRTVQDLESH